MFSRIEFKNFRVLRDVSLDLSPCTLLLGPNGSGKSTVLRGLQLIRALIAIPDAGVDSGDRSVGIPSSSKIELTAVWDKTTQFGFTGDHHWGQSRTYLGSENHTPKINVAIKQAADAIHRLRVYSLDANKVSQHVRLTPSAEIASDGANLPVVLTQLQDQHPERFDALNNDLRNWIPEFDRVLFETPGDGQRAFSLRTIRGRHSMRAEDLSHGSLLALCLLTLSHLPEPPSVVCLEEPDRGIHPRLLRQVHDAMIRLSNPATCGDQRKSVQVIATTHSPYFLDLFRDHPEDVFLAEKGSDGSTFHKLTDMPHFEDIMHDAPLGDAWYTGVLGGVPTSP